MAERDAAAPTQRTLEARLPCPVCLGVQMEKVQLQRGADVLVLDHCQRCGGVWFEKGEVQRLTRHAPEELWKFIPPRSSTVAPPCHSCHAPLARDAETCTVCGEENRIACPLCTKRMERRTHAELTLDVCTRCHGVWFDHAEIKGVWSLSVSSVVAQRTGRGAQAAAMGADVLLETLFWAPGLVVDAGRAVVFGASQVTGAIGQISAEGAANAAIGATEVVGEAAEGVFEAIMAIIASIFD